MIFKNPLLFTFIFTSIFILLNRIFDDYFITAILFTSIFIFFYFWNKYGYFKSIILLLTYLMLFDDTPFIFTGLQFRIWYFVLILYMISFTVYFLIYSTRKIRFKCTYISLLLVPIVGVSFAHFVTDPMVFKIHNLKYWIFYIGLIVVLYKGYLSFNTSKEYDELISFIVSLSLFVSIIGILQVLTTVIGMPLLGEYYRPQAFFSEATWYGEYLIFGIVITYFQLRRSKKKYYLIYVYIELLGVLVSATRNAFLAIIVLIFIEFVIFIFRFKFNYSIFKNIYTFIGLIILSFLIYHFWEMINEVVFKLIIGKLNVKESSANSRLVAFDWSIRHFNKNLIFGNGFKWDGSMITKMGTALGSKSFNLIFMIQWLFGLLGLIPFLIIIFLHLLFSFWSYLINNIREHLLSFQIFTVFLSISMFAPLHQFSFGMYTIALSIFFYKVGFKSEIIIYNAKN